MRRRALTKEERKLVKKYEGVLFGHGIICRFCGWQLTDHLHGLDEGESRYEINKGFEFDLDQCPGYLPIDEEGWAADDATVPQDERDRTYRSLHPNEPNEIDD